MNEIPLEEIQLNVRGALILLDVDGTLTADADYAVSPTARELLSRWGAENRVVLCTNTRDQARRARLAGLFRLPTTSGKYKKPSRKIVTEFVPPVPSKIIVIGDKCLVDGWFAVRIGASFIKSKRLVSGHERWFVKVSYWLDNIIFCIYSWFKNFL
ncbi:MAG: hypothetical protein HY983_00500 [Candidatus Magasanikbacteria bacterium]|nr:hypothetical protein [Candidatus Magasanikbacteria bacterium]